MKTTRRIITLALAAILILGLVIPAFAATTGGTISITGSGSTVYDVYKMLTVEDGNKENENVYKVEDAWLGFVTQDGMDAYFEVKQTDAGKYILWQKETASASDAAVIAAKARAYLESNAGEAARATKVGTEGVQVGQTKTVTENGYYLLVPNNETVSGVIVVKNGETKEITEKTVAPGVPTLQKQVYEDSLQSDAAANTVEIGEEITYKITIVAGEAASNYVLHDMMDEHITLIPDSFSFTRGGHAVTNDPANPIFTVEHPTQSCREDGKLCTFHLNFNETWCNSLTDGVKLVVTYKAVLNAETDGVETETDKDHENTAWLRYTDDPTVKTPESKVATQTREINIMKVDQSGDPLKGAGFVLRNNENQYYKYELNGETGEMEVNWVANKEDATEYTSDENGMLRFYGVDAEAFWLEEISVPGGYTGAGETTINVRNASVKDTNPVKVTNVLGNALPETGGIGTTVFYVLGGILLIGALAALAVMKRKETSAQ